MFNQVDLQMKGFVRGAVSSASSYASDIGISVLKKGGNAVDAAVAVSLTLGVVEPAFSGIGGGGFTLIRLASGETVAVDYRETAPLRSVPDMFSVLPDGAVRDDLNSIGPLAIATPGNVAGLCYLLENYGTMKFKDVSEKAIQQARSGFSVSPLIVKILHENRYHALDKLRKYEATSDYFLRKGKIPRVGMRAKALDLASILQELSTQGRDAFYTGSVAKSIVEHVQKLGGIISLEDLERYSVKTRKPVEGTYRGFTVTSMPPPSAGGSSLIQMLNILENFDYKTHQTDWHHLIVESIKLALRDKAAHFGDPDFVQIPLQTLTGKEYAKKQSAAIQRKETLKLNTTHPADSGSTTHFSIIDSIGNIVTATESIECYFGCGIAVPGSGILLNDEMHDFDPLAGKSNSVEPGKRPVSSMTPTIVCKDGSPVLALGGAGSERIITSVFQVISNLIDRKMSIADSLAEPRIHPTTEGLHVEKDVRPEIMKTLRRRHNVVVKPNRDPYFGGVQAVQVDQKKHTFIGAADPRRAGKAVGY
jgi:gamma-glutamyltranspeptidase/glutathione hydrolase